MPNVVLKFDELKANDATAPKSILQIIRRAGASVASSWVDGKVRRDNAISFKEIHLVFADNQEAVLRVKQSGDIYQVKLNGRAMPIQNQDDHKLAIIEIIDAVDANSNKFQLKLAKSKVKLPVGIQSTVTRKQDALKARITELDVAIAEAQAELGVTMDSADSDITLYGSIKSIHPSVPKDLQQWTILDESATSTEYGCKVRIQKEQAANATFQKPMVFLLSESANNGWTLRANSPLLNYNGCYSIANGMTTFKEALKAAEVELSRVTHAVNQNLRSYGSAGFDDADGDDLENDFDEESEWANMPTDEVVMDASKKDRYTSYVSELVLADGTTKLKVETYHGDFSGSAGGRSGRLNGFQKVTDGIDGQAYSVNVGLTKVYLDKHNGKALEDILSGKTIGTKVTLDSATMDGDFIGHPFRGNQYKQASRQSGAAVAASQHAKTTEKRGDKHALKLAHQSAHYAHKAASIHAQGQARKYHHKMARLHAKHAGLNPV